MQQSPGITTAFVLTAILVIAVFVMIRYFSKKK